MASTQSFFQAVDRLPMEIIDLIIEYIPFHLRILFNKTNYIAHHLLFTKKLPMIQLEKYFRMIIQRDFDFVLSTLLHERGHMWLQYKGFYHRECIYRDYATFLEFYAAEMESPKCQHIVNQWLEINFQHRKKKVKKIQEYITWNN